MLAGLSPDHYSRLEQGRQSTVTGSVLGALARALRLDDVERARLRDLAAPGPGRADAWERAQRPDPGLLRVMTALDGVPVLLLGRRGEVLAGNRLLTAVLGTVLMPGRRSCGGCSWIPGRATGSSTGPSPPRPRWGAGVSRSGGTPTTGSSRPWSNSSGRPTQTWRAGGRTTRSPTAPR